MIARVLLLLCLWVVPARAEVVHDTESLLFDPHDGTGSIAESDIVEALAFYGGEIVPPYLSFYSRSDLYVFQCSNGEEVRELRGADWSWEEVLAEPADLPVSKKEKHEKGNGQAKSNKTIPGYRFLGYCDVDAGHICDYTLSSTEDCETLGEGWFEVRAERVQTTTVLVVTDVTTSFGAVLRADIEALY